MSKGLDLLTFAGQEFFKGLFPPKTFLQGWPKNRNPIIFIPAHTQTKHTVTESIR